MSRAVTIKGFVHSKMLLNQLSMGLKNKKAGDEIYCLTCQCVFPDDDGALRCGRITFCTEAAPNKWVAVTGRWLFTSSWNPSNSRFDPEDDIVGKECYLGEWLSDVRVDVCRQRDKLIKKTVKIGNVVGISHPMAMVAIEPTFLKTKAFLKEGFWTKVSRDAPPTTKEQTCMISSESCRTVIHKLPSRASFIDTFDIPESSDVLSCVRYLFVD